MAWIAMPNENGTKSLVHSDLCDCYLAHHVIKVQKLGVIRSRNKASYSLTNHVSKVATKKADKAHTKYVQQAKKAAEYDDYITKHQNKEAKIDRKKIKVESNLNPLKEIDAEYARSLAEKVDKRKDKK